MDNVCNRRLFTISPKTEMAEEQEYLWCYFCFPSSTDVSLDFKTVRVAKKIWRIINTATTK